MNTKFHLLFLSLTLLALTASAQQRVVERGWQISAGANMDAKADSAGTLHFVVADKQQPAFNQCGVHQETISAKIGPRPDVPYFNVGFALPVPPAYSKKECAMLTGIDFGVYHHNHSPGFEMLSNGDALAIYFSTPRGKSENDTATTFVQARLRHGSLDWDMPEVLFSTDGMNDQSGLLWNDNGHLWFFGGGRNISKYVPFRIAQSDDNGQTWQLSVPKVAKPAIDCTPQPITNAFRGADGAIYMAMDAVESQSFLWRSDDGGITWTDTGGRTGGRHSTIVPLDNNGTLLSIGGKNANVDGWTPMNISTDYGRTWSESKAIHFPQLGSGQRPSMIRLQSGALCFVSDGYLQKHKVAPPKEWERSYNAFVALSRDNGKTWHIKTLPVGLPCDGRPPYTTIGYGTVRQSPDGLIHVLTTKSVPGLHYEFNEAWVYSDKGDMQPDLTPKGSRHSYTESYDNGQEKSRWQAKTCDDGRYLLDGKATDWWPNGQKQHEATYSNGFKTGVERFWDSKGHLLWQWNRDRKTQRGTWTHFWPNGQKKIVSQWNLHPKARDTERQFYGYVADGPSQHFDQQGRLTKTYQFTDGVWIEE